MDDYTMAAMRRIIIAAMCSSGIGSISEPGLDMIVDAAIQRATVICEKTARITNHCGRTDSTIYDLFYALKFLGETPEKLAAYYRGNSDPFHKWTPDFLADPYPIPCPSDFYNIQQTETTCPFRANSTINYPPRQDSPAPDHPSIPYFFPRQLGGMYIDQAIDPDADADFENYAELRARRDRDQQQMKKFLIGCVQKSHQSTEQDIDLSCDLEAPPEIPRRVIEPLPMLEEIYGSIPRIDGERSGVNPETCKRLNEGDEVVAELDRNKDYKTYLEILIPERKEKKKKPN